MCAAFLLGCCRRTDSQLAAPEKVPRRGMNAASLGAKMRSACLVSSLLFLQKRNLFFFSPSLQLGRVRDAAVINTRYIAAPISILFE